MEGLESRYVVEGLELKNGADKKIRNMVLLFFFGGKDGHTNGFQRLRGYGNGLPIMTRFV